MVWKQWESALDYDCTYHIISYECVCVFVCVCVCGSVCAI